MKQSESLRPPPRNARCTHPRMSVVRGIRVNGGGTCHVNERCYRCGKVRRALFVTGPTSKAKLGPWRAEP